VPSHIHRTSEGAALSKADELILEVATGARRPAASELREVLEHVARAGFSPVIPEGARGELAGQQWRGRTLTGKDRLPAAERHYLKHAMIRREWPVGTPFDGYLESIEQTIRDPRSGIFASRYAGSWQLGVVGPSGRFRGPTGGRWILVEYRVAIGYWVTAYQPKEGLRVLRSAQRSELRWLRKPQGKSG